MRMEGKNDVETCATDESCQSKVLHEILNTDLSEMVCIGGERYDLNAVTGKLHMYFIDFLNPCRAHHELGELWNVKYDVIEKGYLDGVKQRGIDPDHELLQVFADPFKLKTSESREDGACWRRWTSVGTRERVVEFDGEKFEVGQHGQASDDRLG
jgi:hypothetical protein